MCLILFHRDMCISPVSSDCREEMYPCTRMYSVHRPIKRCIGHLCFYRWFLWSFTWVNAAVQQNIVSILYYIHCIYIQVYVYVQKHTLFTLGKCVCSMLMLSALYIAIALDELTKLKFIMFCICNKYRQIYGAYRNENIYTSTQIKYTVVNKS